MLRYKALHIIKCFDDDEVGKFASFLDSPCFNNSKKVARLYRILKQFYPGFNSQKLTNRYLKKKIGTRSDSTLKNLFADLYHLCEKFLAFNSYLSSRFEPDLHLISALNSKNLGIACLESIRKFKEKLSKDDEFHTDYLNYSYQVSKIEYNSMTYSSTDESTSKLKDLLEQHSITHDYIFFFYFLNSINIYLETLNICMQLNQDPADTRLGRFFSSFFPVDKIDSLLHEQSFFKNDFQKDIFELKWLYVQITLGDEIFKHSKRYLQLLRKHSHSLSKDEKFNLYQVFNHWYPAILAHKEFEESEFQFYDNLIEQKAYKCTGNEYMSVRDFVHIMKRGYITGRYQWADKLLSQHIFILEIRYHVPIAALGSVYLLLLKQKDFRKAFDFLNDLKCSKELKLKKEIKYLSILLHFELKEYSKAMNSINNFAKFINSKEIPFQDKALFGSFLKYVKILTLYKLEEKEIDINELKSQIRRSDYFVSQDWLLEKIMEVSVG